LSPSFEENYEDSQAGNPEIPSEFETSKLTSMKQDVIHSIPKFNVSAAENEIFTKATASLTMASLTVFLPKVKNVICVSIYTV
jgi:hypothetical protein